MKMIGMSLTICEMCKDLENNLRLELVHFK